MQRWWRIVSWLGIWCLCLGWSIGPVAAQGDVPAPETDAPVAETDTPSTAPDLPSSQVATGSLILTISAPLGVVKQESVSPLVVTIENAGPAFSGQLVVSTTTWTPITQYFQPVEIPSGTTKRFHFNGFERSPPTWEVILLDPVGSTVAREPFSPLALTPNDVLILQLGGHPADFAPLRSEMLSIRPSLEDLVPDINILKNNQAMAGRLFAEPIIPAFHYQRVTPENFPTRLIDLQIVNTLLLDLGTWNQLTDAQRRLVGNYVRTGGTCLFYPALDYGYPSQTLTDPLLPVPLESGFQLAGPRELGEFAARFQGYRPSSDRPLRFLRPQVSPARLTELARLTTPGGESLLLSREEGLGRTGVLLFQPVQLTDLPGAPRVMTQLLDRTGFTDATQQQWFDDPRTSGYPQYGMGSNVPPVFSTGSRVLQKGSPSWNFFLRNWAQRIEPQNTQPFRGAQSTNRLWAVPQAFLRAEGWKLLGFIGAIFLITQLILAVRQRLPAIWALLPAASGLFVLLIAPASVSIEIPYRYAEWDIVRFGGSGSAATLASASWIANLSRHAIPQTLAWSGGPDYFFDEFVYDSFSNDPNAYPIVHVRQDFAPAAVGITPSRMNLPRLFLGWGALEVPGQLHGSLEIQADGIGRLTLQNDTPWSVAGGGLYLQNDRLDLNFTDVPALPAGETITLDIPATAIVQRAQYDPQHPITHLYSWPALQAASQQIRSWVPAQVELLERDHSLRQALMFTRPATEHLYTPGSVLLIAQLQGFESPLLLNERPVVGDRFALGVAALPLSWEAGHPGQDPYGWEYYSSNFLGQVATPAEQE